MPTRAERDPLRFDVMTAGLFALAALALSAHASADTTLPGGTLPGDTTWDLAGSPYTLDGDVVVPAGVTLTIEAGVEVGWNLTYVLQVEGGLVINGTAASPVYIYAGGSSFFPHWVGILFVNHSLPSLIRNATLEQATLAVDVRTPGATLLLEDVSVFSWNGYGEWGLSVEGAASNVAVHRFNVQSIQSGATLQNSSGLEVDGLTVSSLASATPAGLNLTNVSDSRLDRVDVTSYGVYAVGLSNVAFTGLTAQGGSQDALRLRGAANFTLDGAVLSGNYGVRFDNVSDLRLANITGTASSFYGEDGTSVRLERLAMSSTNIASRFFRLTGLAVLSTNMTGPSATLYIVDSPGFVVDRCNLTGSTAAPLWIGGASDGGRISNTSVASLPGLGIHLQLPTEHPDLDVSQGNSIGGRPVLGIYRQPGAQVLNASAYAWVYVFASPGATVAGARLAGGAVNNPAAMWAESPGGTISDWTLPPVAPTGFGMVLVNSSSTAVDRVQSSSWIYARGDDALSISNSTFAGSGADPRQRVVLILSSDGVSLSNVSVLAGGLTFEGNGLDLAASDFCGAMGVVLNNVVGAVLTNLSFCPQFAPGVSLLRSTQVTVQNTTFQGSALGLSINESSSATVRWNRFLACNGTGLEVLSTAGPGTLVFENRFACGARSASDATPAATSWYNATTRRGNWWDDYNGTDADKDGIGDTPYSIPGGTKQDIYPLVDAVEDLPPVAVAFSPYTTDEDVPAPLDGSNSTDDLGNLTGWWLIDLPSGTVNVSGLVTSYTFDTPGTYNITLWVSDGTNRSSATTFVTIRDTTPPVLTPSPANFTGNEDTPTAIFVLATDNDPAFPAGAAFEWTLLGAPPLVWTSFGPSTQVTIADPGNYTVSVAVTDAGGNRATVSLNVTVRDTTPPVCSGSVEADPPPGTNGRFTLLMEYSPDNDPRFPGPGALRWSIITPHGDTRTGQGTPYTYLTEGAGAYTVTYSCTDPAGNRDSGTFTVTVPDNDPPLWSPPGPLVVADGERLTISMEDATDPSGVQPATWYDGNVTLAVGFEISPVWTGLGDHHLRVHITDNAGNSANFTILLRVVDRTAPWLADPNFTALRTVRAGDVLSINAEHAFLDNDPQLMVAGNIQWQAGGPVQGWTPGAFNRSVDVVFASQGNWTIRVTVTDPAGNNATFDLPVLVLRAGTGGPPDGGGSPQGTSIEVLVLVGGVLLAGAAAVVAMQVSRRRREGRP